MNKLLAPLIYIFPTQFYNNLEYLYKGADGFWCNLFLYVIYVL